MAMNEPTAVCPIHTANLEQPLIITDGTIKFSRCYCVYTRHEDSPKERFLDALVEYLAGNEAEMSIKLEIAGKTKKPTTYPEALLWSKIRSTTPLFGYYPGPEGKEKAKKQLRKFLWGD